MTQLRREINERLTRFEIATNERIDRVEREIVELRRKSSTRFYWIMGIMIAMWVSIISALLFGI